VSEPHNFVLVLNDINAVHRGGGTGSLTIMPTRPLDVGVLQICGDQRD